MKILITIFLLLMACSFGIAQNADEEAIKNVIQTETISFYHCDGSTWEKMMLPAEHQSWVVTNFNDPGSAATRKGLKFINNMKNYLNSAECKKSEPNIQYSDWNIQIRDKTAWAAYKERSTMVDGTEIDGYTLKILEKQDGQWKIAATSSVWDFNKSSKPWNPKAGGKQEKK